jgi:hypothetical protein
MTAEAYTKAKVMERAYLTTGAEWSATATPGGVGRVASRVRVERGLSIDCPVSALRFMITVHIPFTDTQLNGT